MKSFTIGTARVLFVSMVIGLFVAGTAIPVGTEETPTAAKKAVAPPMVPSLADVVYQAGALNQRLSALKSRPETVGNLQRLEQRLQRADSQTVLFNSRLSLLKDDDLQSYQQLAALKGEVRSEADDVKRVAEFLSETIRDVESRRRSWLAEKARWEGGGPSWGRIWP
jgi:hypothetical protein